MRLSYISNPKLNLDEVLQEIMTDSFWDYKLGLKLSSSEIHTATHDMLLDNPDDIADGVTKVEVVLQRRFFDLFKGLEIKHFDNGEVRLNFYAQIKNSKKITLLYQQLCTALGSGMSHPEQFIEFNDVDKLSQLASCKFNDNRKGFLHHWYKGTVGFTLYYKVKPDRQLVFAVSLRQGKIIDNSARIKGTLINISHHKIADVLLQTEITAIPTHEDNRLKFIDYTFELDPPEFNVFEKARIRIFGNDTKDISKDQFHVTYYSRFEIDTNKAITLCDQLVRIYGMDNNGYAEFRPYEIASFEEDSDWTGRDWWINNKHALADNSKSDEVNLYWINFHADPNEDGLALCIVGYNQMLEYHSSHFIEKE